MQPALLLPYHKEQQEGRSWASDEADPAPALPQGAAEQELDHPEADPAPAKPKGAAGQELDQRWGRSCSCIAKKGGRGRPGPVMEPTLPLPRHKKQQSVSWTSDGADPAPAPPQRAAAGQELDRRWRLPTYLHTYLHYIGFKLGITTLSLSKIRVLNVFSSLITRCFAVRSPTARAPSP